MADIQPVGMTTPAALRELADLLKEALPFIDTNPDLHRPGGDELSERIAKKLNQLRTAASEGGDEPAFFVPDALVKTCKMLHPTVKLHRVTVATERTETHTIPLYLHPPTDSGAGRDGWISVPRADWERMATCGCGCNRKSCPMCGEELLGEPAAEPPAHDTAISGAAGVGNG